MATNLQYRIGQLAPVRLRQPEDGEDYAGTVEVASSRSCRHTETMCSKCQPQWRQDWFIANPSTSIR